MLPAYERDQSVGGGWEGWGRGWGGGAVLVYCSIVDQVARIKRPNPHRAPPRKCLPGGNLRQLQKRAMAYGLLKIAAGD